MQRTVLKELSTIGNFDFLIFLLLIPFLMCVQAIERITKCRSRVTIGLMDWAIFDIYTFYKFTSPSIMSLLVKPIMDKIEACSDSFFGKHYIERTSTFEKESITSLHTLGMFTLIGRLFKPLPCLLQDHPILQLTVVGVLPGVGSVPMGWWGWATGITFSVWFVKGVLACSGTRPEQHIWSSLLWSCSSYFRKIIGAKEKDQLRFLIRRSIDIYAMNEQ